MTPFTARKPSVISIYIEEQMVETLKVLDDREIFFITLRV